MNKQRPTYSAAELKSLAMTITDAEGIRALATLINEEIELYNDDDMAVILSASMIIFVKSLMIGSIKLLPL